METRRAPMCHVTLQDQGILEEAEDDVDPRTAYRDQPDGEEDLEGLPWHHAQLVMLYGRKVADDIVHPKMERAVVIDPKLKPEGPTGAAQLWSMLRNDSTKKLRKEDNKIPTDLKRSYGAFVRQLVLQKNEVPVQRNFSQTRDVPDLDHLLDKERLYHALKTRHKIELMGRSSKLNQDKTEILMYNNPLPDLSNMHGHEGIGRYLPSWAEQDEESIASYRKWIDEDKRLVPVIKPSESMQELVRPVARDGSRHNALPKVTFLTEAEAGADKGQFSDKYKTKREEEHSVANPTDHKPNIDINDVTLRPFRGDNVRTPSAGSQSRNKKPNSSTWEPLTLNALVEYSDKKYTHGEGRFKYGSVKMYPVESKELNE